MKKKILITGGCGFIGSHVVELFHKKNLDIVVLDKYNFDNHKGWLEEYKYKSDIEFLLGDIRDYDFVKSSIFNCENILHLAALIGIPYSYISPLAYIKTNIEGTYNILEAIKGNDKINNLIITSTSEVYGSGEHFPMNEDHKIQAQSPYSATKISADALSISFFKSFGLPITILRPFNNYGPRQSNRAIIPTIISQFFNDNEHIEVGNTNTIRDFTYVTDTANAYYLALKNNNYGEIFNVSSGFEISIENLISKISKIINISKKIKKSKKRVRPSKSEVTRLLGDSNKFKDLTGWSPSISLTEGLVKTTEWIKKSEINLKNSKNYIV